VAARLRARLAEVLQQHVRLAAVALHQLHHLPDPLHLSLLALVEARLQLQRQRLHIQPRDELA
jgi:hypothetical protein